MLFGVDVSSWKPIQDIGAVKQAGNQFLITKCTGGLTYKNPLYADQIAKARGAEMGVGHFHFLHESGVNPTTQADYRSMSRMQAEVGWFLANLDWRPGEPVCVDVEDEQVHGDLSEAVLLFCAEVEHQLGIRPLIYTYPYYRDASLTAPQLARYPLWWAAYDEPERYATTPWPRWTLRQYTANASVPGIGADVDRNIFNGTLAEWRKLGMPDSQQQQTTPTAITTPETNWGEGSKGRIVHRAETIIVVNDETKQTYLGIRIDGNQLPWKLLS